MGFKADFKGNRVGKERLRRCSLALLLVLQGALPQAYGQTTGNAGPKDAVTTGPRPSAGEAVGPTRKASVFEPAKNPSKPRSTVFIPIVSFLLPGFDQWWEGQYGSAAAYTGVALAGYSYSARVASAHGLLTSGQKKPDPDSQSSDDEKKTDTLDTKDDNVRKVVFGGLVAQGAGGMSAYHAFRTAARSRQSQGEFTFLTYEETPLEVLAAPFHLEYVKRPTTYIPLAIGAAFMALSLNAEVPKEMERVPFGASDAFFTAAYSYNAGTHEEAMFRGWVMPLFYQAWDSPFWSNAAQSVLFAAAHLGTNPMPLPQLLLGYHLGYTTQKNQWRLGESVFIHAWWDIFAFATSFHFAQKEEAAGRLAPRPVLWLPPLELTF